MRKLAYIIVCLALAAIAFNSCSKGDDTTTNYWEEYADWRNANDAWIEAKAAQTGYYRKVVPEWDPSAYVLIHYFNDRSKTASNLTPKSTSTVDVKYRGRIYTDEPFDSSYLQTQYGDSIYRSQVNANIVGWIIALTDMHVSDSCEVIIPYRQAYGGNKFGSKINPYSNLIFDIKLVDIPFYEQSSK